MWRVCWLIHRSPNVYMQHWMHLSVQSGCITPKMRTNPCITAPEHTPPLRSCLCNDDRRALAPYLHTQHYRRGAFLFQAGEVANQLFWICQGIVKLSAPTLEGGCLLYTSPSPRDS